MIKLISVVASISGEEFETPLGLLPQFRRDLRPDQVEALTDYMNPRGPGSWVTVLPSNPPRS